MMRSGVRIGLVVVTLGYLSAPLNAQTPDNSLKLYAVQIVKTLPFRSQLSGDGVYLGQGLVITAAHVVGHWPFFTRPRVLIAGQDLPAKVIKEGSFPKIDLALLSVDEERLPVSLRLRRNPLCQKPPGVGMQVIDVAPDGLKPSRIISPFLIPQEMQSKFSTLIAAPQGSGSGLFDSDKKCLVGIVSGEIQKFHYKAENGRLLWKTNGLAGYFVSAATIANFLPANIRF